MQINHRWSVAVTVVVFVGLMTVPRGANSNSDTPKLLDTKPNATLLSFIEMLFTNATSISIKYTNLETVEPAYFSKVVSDSDWQSSFTRRCRNGCGHSALALRSRLSSGLKISRACPPPFSIVVTFAHEGTDSIQNIYVNGTGQCFSVGNDSYFVDQSNSILQLVKKSLAPLE